MATTSVIAFLLSTIFLIAPFYGYTTKNFRFDKLHGECDGARCASQSGGPWTCDDIWTDTSCSSSWGICPYSCECNICRRDCSLEEIKVSPSACEIASADIPAIKKDASGEIMDVLWDFDTGVIGIADPFAGLAMAFAKQMLDFFSGGESIYNLMIKDVNKRLDAMGKCFGEMISQSQAKEQIDDMQAALIAYQTAEETDKSKIAEKAQATFYTWEKFIEVIGSKFDNKNKEAVFYKTLLAPLQNFAALYSLLAVDYMVYLKVNSDLDFDDRLKATLSSMSTLIDWTHDAKAVIVKDFNDKLDQLPCKNNNAIVASLVEWEIHFVEANTEPIVQYYNALAEMSDQCQQSYSQGDCNDGYVDKTRGSANFWGCGKDCEGGANLVDDSCNCACILDPADKNCHVDSWPTVHISISNSNHACGKQTKSLGKYFKNVNECAYAAIADHECTSGEIMWSSSRSYQPQGYSYGCGCCQANSGYDYNDDWSIYAYNANNVGFESLSGLDEMNTDALKLEGSVCEFDAIGSGDDAMQIEVLKAEDRYFFFDSSQLDENHARRGEVMTIRNDRTGSMVNVMVWKDGHARKHPRKLAKRGDWKVGDIFTVVGDNCAEGLRCLAIGDDGEFTCQSTGKLKGGRARLLTEGDKNVSEVKL